MTGNNGDYSAKGLDGLLTTSKNAQQYFSALPEYVQEMIIQRKNNIKSEDELHRYSDNIMQGDK